MEQELSDINITRGGYNHPRTKFKIRAMF